MMQSTHALSTQLLLEQWARWRHYQSGEVRGYPREVPFYRMMRGAGVSDPYITDDAAERVDAAVARLSARCPDQGQALKLRYLEGHSHVTIAKAMRIGSTSAGDLVRAGERAVEWILECT